MLSFLWFSTACILLLTLWFFLQSFTPKPQVFSLESHPSTLDMSLRHYYLNEILGVLALEGTKGAI